MLTFDVLLVAADHKVVDQDFLAALNALSHSPTPALERHGLFVDEDETEHELSKDDLRAALDGRFFHPQTGEQVPDAQDRIVIFFTTSPTFESRAE